MILDLHVAEQRFQTSSDGRCVENVQHLIFTGSHRPMIPGHGRWPDEVFLGFSTVSHKKGRAFIFFVNVSVCVRKHHFHSWKKYTIRHSMHSQFFFPMHFENSFQDVFHVSRMIQPPKNEQNIPRKNGCGLKMNRISFCSQYQGLAFSVDPPQNRMGKKGRREGKP